MKPYSEDLRVRIVRAVQEGTPKSAAARLFGVSLSSVKRYARMADRGTSLAPRKGGGRLPKADETTRRLLEEDVKERPAATVTQRRHFLQRTMGKALSYSTVGRPFQEDGLQSKKRSIGALERNEFRRASWSVMVSEKVDPQQLVSVDEM